MQRHASLTSARIARLLLGIAGLAIASYAAAQGRFCASDDTLIFGNRTVGSSTSATATISNCGDQPWSFTDVSIDPATGAAYHIGRTCATGLALAPGASCTVTVTFAPTMPGQTSGAVWLRNTTNTPDQLLTFYGRGVDTQGGMATLSFAPSALSFGAQVVGTQSAGLTVQLVNQGPAPLTPSALVLTGPAAYDYSAIGDCNVGTPIAPAKSCTLTFFFQPAALGNRPANLVVDSPQLANLAILPIGGVGIAVTLPDADVIEFFYPPLNTFFLTASPAEAAFIDAGGVGAAWVRTGFHFRAWSAENTTSGAAPACRFTGTPDLGPNSHFFTVDDNECMVVKANPYWMYEGIAFRALPPSGGSCAAGMTPVVRFLWSGTEVESLRHRYVVDAAEAARMRAAGWLEEGVVFCAPP
ncbi:MAG TPA: choice-of-anchor D domain-containing protein [Casimicrobiaceae bacterium]|nr:choice-of-anchor D domain-containing protein [Casimicrobiaceae bacterium]